MNRSRLKRKRVLEREKKRIIECLAKEYRPIKIILFGSLNQDSIHEASDIDLLILKETDKRPIERQMEAYRLIKPKVGIDLFIYTPEEFEYLKSIDFSLLKKILQEGKVVYEAGS